MRACVHVCVHMYIHALMAICVSANCHTHIHMRDTWSSCDMTVAINCYQRMV